MRRLSHCRPLIAKPRSTGSPPAFPTGRAYVARLDDIQYWWPYAARVFDLHGMEVGEGDVEAGEGGTFPTLVCGDVVIKLFGHLPFWRRAYDAELAAMSLITEDPHILVPKLLACGKLFAESTEPWPYLVTTRMPGSPWEETASSAEEKSAIAANLGCQVRRISALAPTADIATPDTWHGPSLVEAAMQSVLPSRLIAQMDDYIAGADRDYRVFLHGDLMFRHVFVESGRLAGIIDWGDALVADRHYELAQIQLNLFDGDKTLLRTFLDHSNWPVERDFPRRALTEAFRRQAVGLAQHGTMDVFHKLPWLLPLEDIATLEELATAVFGV